MMKQRQKNKAEVKYKRISKHSDSDEETELLTVKKSPKKDFPNVEKVVEEGDTLQSLAIRYGCTIEDLKRLNNIHKENEIYAKRTMKVPLRPFTMALAGVHVSGRNSPPSVPPAVESVDCDKVTASLKQAEVNEIIFNSNITQKSLQIENARFDEEEEESISLLPQNTQTGIPKGLSFSGVDGDISLKALIFCIVILIFAVPLIYVFYIYEHPSTVIHDKM